jgi:3D-(3,5/4)-trihydroxycyclohexane-1,2-dione acylhydrolase (decyclizing)
MDGFGTRFAFPQDGRLPGDTTPSAVQELAIDYAANARSLGAVVFECSTTAEYARALEKAHTTDRTTVIVVKNDRYIGVPGYESWWDVAVSEVSTLPEVQAARRAWQEMRKQERLFFK